VFFGSRDSWSQWDGRWGSCGAPGCWSEAERRRCPPHARAHAGTRDARQAMTTPWESPCPRTPSGAARSRDAPALLGWPRSVTWPRRTTSGKDASGRCGSKERSALPLSASLHQAPSAGTRGGGHPSKSAIRVNYRLPLTGSNIPLSSREKSTKDRVDTGPAGAAAAAVAGSTAPPRRILVEDMIVKRSARV
jgi:hypothetical protein